MVAKLTELVSSIDACEIRQKLLSDSKNNKGMLRADSDEVQTILNLPGVSYLVEVDVETIEQLGLAVNNAIVSMENSSINYSKAKGLLVKLCVNQYPKVSQLKHLLNAIDVHFDRLNTAALFNVYEDNCIENFIGVSLVLTGIVTD